MFIGGPSGSPDLGPKDRPSPQQYVCGTDFHVRLAQAKTRELVMGNPFRALDGTFAYLKPCFVVTVVFYNWTEAIFYGVSNMLLLFFLGYGHVRSAGAETNRQR